MEDTLSLMSDWKAELESLGAGKMNLKHKKLKSLLREWGDV
jgi:hypothetical protein